ncbi:ABC transporter ATP-binding protein [Lentzea sp. BCCO 10_0856]|uniref:ABC transporter ATP-binding protein n=1 Tax=Lentzea miocenica TaxID=3095431 RepID=A0ABU4T393_9PSEU|nr:ABC transporter ATP-binding protein [Lentzea sp. BCCO 10_0856]MDX8032627.1 ABC transporter ATP-binding protein [Lentzea sp. BCCO 10_0856]
MITVEGVYAGYGSGDVLQGLDLVVEEGSVTCVVGPNGAGKSTVLRTLSGLLKPRLGRIRLGDRVISGLHPADVLSAGVVQVPQQNGLFPAMTVRENVLLGGYVRRRDKELLRRRYDELTAMFPIIAERAGDPAGNLSGGQRRMVEFARALMIDPKVVLLDEPSLGLDPKALESVRDSVAAMREAGMTVLMVEQNVRFGLGIATHGVVMESGRVLLTDTAEGLSANEEIGELFLGGVPR